MYEPLIKAHQKEELKTGRHLKKEIKPSQTIFHQMKFMPGEELNYREKQNVPYRQQGLGDFRRDSSKSKEGTGGSLLSRFNFLLSAAYPVQRSSASAEGASGAESSVRDQLLGKVVNPELKSAITEMYRKNATIGDGGLAAAVSYELSTGKLVGGKSHQIKARERVTNLNNIIKEQPLNSEDLEIAKKLLDDLKKALGDE